MKVLVRLLDRCGQVGSVRIRVSTGFRPHRAIAPIAFFAAATFVAGLVLAGSPARAGTVDMPVQAGGPFSISVRSIKERRFLATVHQQRDFSCGSAALATLLTHHYHRAVSEESVFAEMAAAGDLEKIRREGFSLLDMKRYLAAHGFQADGFEASLADLAPVGLPAIALINERGYNHFVVVKGVRDGRVLVGDPAAGTRAMPIARFESVRANGILFVIGNEAGNGNGHAGFNLAPDWSAAPSAVVANRLDGNATASVTLPRPGSNGL